MNDKPPIIGPQSPSPYEDFLRAHLPGQTHTVAHYRMDDGLSVWLKKAGRPNPPWHYTLQGLLTGLLGLGVLRPVPNPGGEAALAFEVEHLRAMTALGLRVPRLLARVPGALLLADAGETPGSASLSLDEGIRRLLPADPVGALALWRRGMDAVASVHALGTHLSQAFARNLVLCPDGAIAYVDFEDDPGAVLAPPECQARDWLSYLHSTAWMLAEHGLLDTARPGWRAALAEGASPAVQDAIDDTVRRMAWMRRLPSGKRWGRDTLRLRAAALLLAG